VIFLIPAAYSCNPFYAPGATLFKPQCSMAAELPLNGRQRHLHDVAATTSCSCGAAPFARRSV
jgi:hypothetical protein